MNYLAHLYLSGDNEMLMTGNFIGDYVKGNKYLKFPGEIQKGIIMHRNIDTYTDLHKKFREAKKLFRPEYGLYSGIVVDLFYDHFLAKNWSHYSDITLQKFSAKAHAVLLSNFSFLPATVQGFLPILIKKRRLESYASTEGIKKSLEAMSHYTSLPSKSKKAIQIMKSNTNFFENNFRDFMQDIIEYLEIKFQHKIKKPRENSPM